MISVSARDASKGLELGLGAGGGREMEEAELEEGEACSYQNNEDYDASIDPDVALSYIDEKLQDVLGHFQKDFEGGVSAENLGAKFGGYGSFLPSYHRSPVWSHPRTPSKVQNYSILKSPNILQLGEGFHNSALSSTTPPSVRPGPPSTSSTSPPVAKGPTVNESFKQEGHVPYAHDEDLCPKDGSVNKTSSNLLDQKTLKVRIKVGSENLMRKSAAIYSGLGLDVSPCSSLDNTPSDSEGMCCDVQDTTFESPTSILQIMTSFPVHGGLLLSPLPNDLIHLNENQKPPNNRRPLLVCKSRLESDVTLGNMRDFVKDVGKELPEKNVKSMGENDVSSEPKRGKYKNSQNGMVMSNDEPEIDSLTCEELVTNTLKLPLLSNLYHNVGEMTIRTHKASDTFSKHHNVMVRNQDLIDGVKEMKEDQFKPPFIQDDRKQKHGSAGKFWEGKNSSFVDEISVFSKKDGHHVGERNLDSATANASSKGKKAHYELMDPLKQKVHKTSTPQEQDETRTTPGKENSVAERVNRSTGNQSSGPLVGNVPKESLRVGSSSDSKIKNFPKGNITSQKDLEINRERHRDFFGVLQEVNPVDLLEMPSEDQLKHSDLREESKLTINSAVKERASVEEKGKPLKSEAYYKATSTVTPHLGNEPVSDAAPATVDPGVIEENWVCCDKCQKWRLLPLGKNPANLPDKWICSMLDWLPGMNRCSFSEEETTKALAALYQVTAPQSQSNLYGSSAGGLTEGTLRNVQYLDQNQHGHTLHAMPSSGKKKSGANVMSPQLSYLMKKKAHASVKSRSLNDMSQSPVGSEVDYQILSKSSDRAAEKHKKKHKKNQGALELHSCGDEKKSSRKKSRRDPDQDNSRATKKIKSDSMAMVDEYQRSSDHNGTSRKVAPSSSSAFPNTSGEKEQPRYIGCTSKDSKYEAKSKQQVSVKERKDDCQASVVDVSLEVGVGESKDTAKKRKSKKQDIKPCFKSIDVTGDFQKSRDLLEFSESDSRKERKAKILKSEGKDSTKDRGINEEICTGMENQQLGRHVESTLSQRSLDDADSLKRDLGSIQPSVAATSSSSKISGSHKTISSFQEVRGSPVESVSSLPMRLENPENLRASRNLPGKNVSQDTIDSPQRCSDGENDGRSDQSGTQREDKPSVMVHNGILDSSVPDSAEQGPNVSGSKIRVLLTPSSDVTNHLRKYGGSTSGVDAKYPKEQSLDENKQNNTHSWDNESHPSRSGKGSSSRLKEKNRRSNTNHYTDKIEVRDGQNELQKSSPLYEVKDNKKYFEKFVVRSDKIENQYVSKKDSRRKSSSGSSKREIPLNTGEHGLPDVKKADACRKDTISTSKKNWLHSSNIDRTDPVETDSGRRKLPPLLTSGGGEDEMSNICPQPTGLSQKGNTADILQIDPSEGNNAMKEQKRLGKVDHQNGAQPISSKRPMPNGCKVGDVQSPGRKDSSNQAASNAVKEAKDLKHLADRLKNTGSTTLESTGLYFQAALKFLHGASLMEFGKGEISKQSEMIQSRQIYSSTAKLCEFCAHEYERSEDMAAAALAYKCTEVAYMKVIYSSHAGASRDRLELQTALQMAAPGESPSPSASDVDNLNNPTKIDKVVLTKGVSFPQVHGNHIIPAKNHPYLVRTLNFVQDVNFAMEASRRSRIAFAAANVKLEGTKYTESISGIRKALDFNFHDVEGLLHLLHAKSVEDGLFITRRNLSVHICKLRKIWHLEAKSAFCQRSQCELHIVKVRLIIKASKVLEGCDRRRGWVSVHIFPISRTTLDWQTSQFLTVQVEEV